MMRGHDALVTPLSGAYQTRSASLGRNVLGT
jgi:hypothetical protein